MKYLGTVTIESQPQLYLVPSQICHPAYSHSNWVLSVVGRPLGGGATEALAD